MLAMLVNMLEAKTRLSELVAAAEAGEEVIIARAGTPVMRLTPVSPGQTPLDFGALAGQIEIGEDFDAPLGSEWDAYLPR